MSELEDRFWTKVDKTDDCWLWTASIRGPGYGQCTVAVGRQGYAHRFAWELSNGPIPAGLHVDHICFNRLCVRVDHLRLVTPKQNGEHRPGAYANSKTRVRGVVRRPARRTFIAQVRHRGKTIYIGSYSTLEEAGAAAQEARLELFTHNDVDRASA